MKAGKARCVKLVSTHDSKVGVPMKVKLIILFAVVSMASACVFIRMTTAPSPIIAMYRLGMSAIILLPIVLTKYRKELFSLHLKDIAWFSLGGMLFAIHFMLYFEAIHNTTVAAGVTLSTTEVFFVALAAYPLFGEKITKKGWLGICLAFIGCVIVTMDDGLDGGQLYGNLLAIATCIFVAGFTLIGKKCRKGVSNIVYTFVVCTSGTLTMLVGCMLQNYPLFGYPPVDYYASLYLAVFPTLLGHGLLSWGLKYEKATFISSMKLLIPGAAVLFAWAFLDEPPTWVALVGGVLIISGILYYNKQKSIAEAINEPTTIEK